MNIIVLLQLALSLLANPQVQINPAYKAEAISFANTAISLAEQATATYAETNTQTVAPNQDTSSNPTGSILGSPAPIVPSAPVTTLASNPAYQGSSTIGACYSTSTEMCVYQEGSAEGGKAVPMLCAQLELCSATGFSAQGCP